MISASLLALFSSPLLLAAKSQDNGVGNFQGKTASNIVGTLDRGEISHVLNGSASPGAGATDKSDHAVALGSEGAASGNATIFGDEGSLVPAGKPARADDRGKPSIWAMSAYGVCLFLIFMVLRRFAHSQDRTIAFPAGTRAR